MGRVDPKKDETIGRVVPDEKSWYEMAVQDLDKRATCSSHTSLPDLYIYLTYYSTILNTFKFQKICIFTSGLQVTSKRTKLYSAFWRENSRNHFNCWSFPTQCRINACVRTSTFGCRDGLVAIGTDRYHILQRVGGHWSPLIQIATDVGTCSRWEKSEFRF